MSQNIQAIIFDIGNVIINVDLERCPKTWAASGGIDLETARKIFWADSHYQLLERGEITLSQYHDCFNKQLDGLLDYSIFEKSWCDIFSGLVDGIEPLIDSVSGNCRLLCLSNTNIAHADFFIEKYSGLFAKFEKIFLSHEMGLRKPDAEIYLSVLKYLNLPAENVLFVDDKAANVKAAKELGMQALEFASTEQLKKYLQQQ